MFKKSLITFLSLLMAAAMLLAACTPPAAQTPIPAEQKPAESQPTQATSNSQPATLRVWITWGDNPQQLQSLFDKYGAANNVKVEVTAPVTDDKVITGLSGSEPPDVLILSGPDNVWSWQHEGLVTPLDDYFPKANIDTGDIYPAVLRQCVYGGKTYCLPWGTDIYALYWNKDLFEAAGLDPEKPPQTLEELAQYADKLTKKDANGEVTQVGFIPDFAWAHNELYTRMFGGFWVSDDSTKFLLDSKPMLDSYKWQQPFYCKYGADKVLKFTTGSDYMSPDQGFYAGKIAMMVDGEWQTGPNFIQKFKPELNYGVAPLPPPASNPERANTAVVAGTVAIIPMGVKDKDASAKLLAWMMSPDILAEEMYTNYNLPTSKKAAADLRFQENPKFKVFLNLIANKNATYGIYTPITAQLTEELGKIDEQALHTCADPAPLLKELQAQLQPALDSAMKK